MTRRQEAAVLSEPECTCEPLRGDPEPHRPDCPRATWLRVQLGLLDVDRLRNAIYTVSLRHDWANTVDTEDRTEEIAAEYARPTGSKESRSQ